MVKILCIEDEPMIRLQIVEELQDEGYDVVEAVDGQDGLEKILEHRPDIVISDVSMPRMSGHDLLVNIRTNFPQFAEMPFVFLTALSNRQDTLHGLGLGADDYLTKPIDFDILLSKIDSLMGQVQRIQKKNKQQLEHIAYHDMLTNLPNRRMFHERLDLAMQRVGQDGAAAVLLLDLNGFKNVNDTLGHLAGDELLKMVAERLMACVASSDIVARMGGDEFAVLQVANKLPEDAEVLAEAIHHALSSPFNVNGSRVQVDTSIGISFAADDDSSKEQLLGNADLALYRAKELEPGSTCLFDLELDTRLKARRALEVDLRHAVARGEFQLHYQPIYDVFNDSIATVEALVRWHHPTKGLIPPGDFIELAEETGLIEQLGEWVMNQACSDAANWPDYVDVAINLSPIQFRNEKLPLLVAEALSNSGLSPGRLELEITESTLLEDNDRILDTLHQLKSLGPSLAMDDFGTGYSSLSYLQKYPFDKIKIDRSFIGSIASERGGMAIFKAILGLAEALDMKTTAEGIETEEQLQLLRQEGCKFAQGYLYSRPVPAAEICALFHLEEANKVALIA
ncbi:MAG: EAL domain-containing protein [Hyphomicrobiaceae bacterium]